MKRYVVYFLMLAGLASISRAAITTEVYRINTGDYVTFGGFVGVYTNSLPNAEQMFLMLRYNFDIGKATMRILGEDFQTEFRSFIGGRIVGGQILFSNEVNHPLHPLVMGTAILDYTVQLGNASIWVNGSITAPPQCCDIPNDFRHVEVHATIMDGPPPNPIGVYDYRGYDPLGTLIVEGILEIRSRTNPIEGAWRLQGVGDPEGIGPQIGMGLLSGNIEVNGLMINLNPRHADDNVYLDGVLSRDSYTGGWVHTTFLGPVTNGTFVAEKKSIRLHSPVYDTNGITFSCDVDAGMLCAIEYTEQLGREEWLELTRFVSHGGVEEIRDDRASERGRFYRLKILDATGVRSLMECARRLLATHLTVAPEEVNAIWIEGQEFPDSCCGCAVPNMFCADVISPGYSIFLEARGEEYEVRTCGGPMILCQEGRGVVIGNCE